LKAWKNNSPSETTLVCASGKSPGTRTCLSCGTTDMNGGRRYCSAGCREQILWVLSLAKGLLRVFNARYAAFAFDDSRVFLDILPLRSREISRFSCMRRNGRKPAEDLKELILQSGEEWHEMVSNHNSKGYASLFLLRKNQDHTVPPHAVMPDRRVSPRFSRTERESMKALQLGVNELLSKSSEEKIRSAYRRMAKVHHPDMGGRAEDFRRLTEAHEQMLFWAENPRFTSRKALTGCWSYDGYTNRWVPPL
jgi:hypothetical protein